MAFMKLVLALGYVASSAVAAYTGDMTYYTPGLGACGGTNVEADKVVALPPGQYGDDANPNNSASCGRTISIHYDGRTVSGVLVADKCPSCQGDHIDVSPSVFAELADLDRGRVVVTWDYE